MDSLEKKVEVLEKELENVELERDQWKKKCEVLEKQVSYLETRVIRAGRVLRGDME